MKRKLPDPIIKDERFFCPDCNKDFPSKPSYNMHWFHVHTDAFKNKNRKRRTAKKTRKYTKRIKNNEPQIIDNKWFLNFCPGCGLSLNPINMALNLVNKHESQEK